MEPQGGNTIVVEGNWAVEALLDLYPENVLEVVFERGRHLQALERCVREQIPHRIIESEQISAEAGYSFHRGILAKAARPPQAVPSESFLSSASKVVLAAGLSDPGNLGTVIRSAVAFGAEGILIPAQKGADVYSRKCIRASATAVFRTKIFEVESIERWLAVFCEHDWISFGFAIGSETTPMTDARAARKSLLIFGSEKEGLPDSVLSLCDELISIEMASGMESLNVGATAAIGCHHFFASTPGTSE